MTTSSQKGVPDDIIAEMIKRGKIKAPAIKKKPEHQHELDMCQNRETDTDGIEYFFDNYLKTYDPRLPEGQRTVQFKLFPKQREYLQWFMERRQNRERGYVAKVRDVGASFTDCGIGVWCWLFEKESKVGYGSNKLEKVDTIGDTDSLFEKIRIMIRDLPDWMLPAGYLPHVHSKQANIINPENGSSLKGEGGRQIGRGGRTSLYFLDEAAFIEYYDEVRGALSANTDVIIFTSTPCRPGDEFDREVHSNVYPVFTFWWQDDPRHNRFDIIREDNGQVLYSGNGYCDNELLSEFTPRDGGRVKAVFDYDIKTTKLEPDPVRRAREYYLSFNAGVEGICIKAEWVKAAIDLVNHPNFKAIWPGYANLSERVAGLDIATSGVNRTVLTFRKGIEVETPLTWVDNSTNTAHRAVKECIENKCSMLYFDAIGVGSGVQGALETSELPPNFTYIAVIGGATPSDMTYESGKTAKELYSNLRAEGYMRMAHRFEKAYDLVVNNIPAKLDELISIPYCLELITELSMPLIEQKGAKIQIESKINMKKRGVASPDYADSLMYTMLYNDVGWGEILRMMTANISSPIHTNIPAQW